MAANGKLLSVIGDEETVVGFLLAGIGQKSADSENFFVVKGDTPAAAVEDAFTRLTTRDDIAILLINQHVAQMIRPTIQAYSQTIPTILEIPSKDHPYDPEKDTVMQRVMMTMGENV